MKCFLSIGLVVIGVSLAINTSVAAEGNPIILTKPVVRVNDRISTQYTTPFELVGSAYQGQYRTQSIPGFMSLMDGVRTGEITAKDLVKAAIDTKNLPPEMINDRNYISNVDFQLRAIRF